LILQNKEFYHEISSNGGMGTYPQRSST
jgi:hypothetical protein